MSIPVYEAVFTEEDAQAAYNVVKSGILSSFGPEVVKLEASFASYVGSKYALSCSSGTTALYLALLPIIKPGDMVAVPTCSYAATAFAAEHHNAQITFLDCDITNWNMDLNQLDTICKDRRATGKAPIKVVIAVHNYGNPINMHKLMELSAIYEFIVVEDACEALTSIYNNKQIGSIGHIGVFSFYGNKLIATGEGGMVVTNNVEYYNRMKLERGQGQDPNRRFWHLVPGWNFRLTNLQAAVANSQFSRLDSIVKRKIEVYEQYRDHLDADLMWQKVPTLGKNCWWMVSVRHWEDGWYQKAATHLSSKGIETRPIFPPIHKMPAMVDYNNLTLANAEHLWDTAITLPSGPGLSNEQIAYVCNAINEIV